MPFKMNNGEDINISFYGESNHQTHNQQQESNFEDPDVLAFRQLEVLSGRNGNRNRFCGSSPDMKNYNTSSHYPCCNVNREASSRYHPHCSSNNFCDDHEKKMRKNDKDYTNINDNISTVSSLSASSSVNKGYSHHSSRKRAPGAYHEDAVLPSLLSKKSPMVGKPKDDSQYYYHSSDSYSKKEVQYEQYEQYGQHELYQQAHYPQHAHHLQQYRESTVTFVEIMPGVKARLRDTKETWNAIKNDFYSPVICFGCSNDLFCISDAQYVICPDCRVVSPMEETATNMSCFVGDATSGGGGVGLGFKFDDLVRWQEQIMQGRPLE